MKDETLEDLGEGAEDLFTAAIQHWWASKGQNSKGISKSQGGTRDSNLRGDTMDGFRDALIEALKDIGVDEEDIYCGPQLATLASNLPSYFRASKNWDLIVVQNSHHKRLDNPALPKPRLLAAIEFKSQEKSIGNNQNNRLEESIGNAHDFWASYEQGTFNYLVPRPWLGYLFVGRYKSGDETKPVEIRQPHFVTDPAFEPQNGEKAAEVLRYKGPSYAERYRIFLERMIAKKLYDGACFLVTDPSIAEDEQNYRVLFPHLSGKQFVDGLQRHLKAYYFD